MDQFTEEDVRQKLGPHHNRIRKVIDGGYAEWLAVKRFMAEYGLGPVLYPRTIANFVFDAVVRHALAEFDDDADIRIVQETQTVKFCFADMVLARFKKGDEDNLGQNLPTQAVLDFVSVQGAFPGLPPSAAKVEFLYSATDIDDGIERVVVAARNGDQLLWHYELEEGEESEIIVPFPSPVALEEDEENAPLVTPLKRGVRTADKQGD